MAVMATVTPATRADRKLQLKEVLDWLVEDGLAEPEAATKILQDSRMGSGSARRHPVVVIGEARMRSRKAPHPVLNADAVTEWLAQRLKVEFYHIDPLKIDLKSVVPFPTGVIPFSVPVTVMSLTCHIAKRPGYFANSASGS